MENDWQKIRVVIQDIKEKKFEETTQPKFQRRLALWIIRSSVNLANKRVNGPAPDIKKCLAVALIISILVSSG